MFEFLKSKKRKEQERLEEEALEARQKRLVQQPPKRNPYPTTQQVVSESYSNPSYMLEPSKPWRDELSFIPANETSNKLSEGSGSFSGAGSSSSWDDSSSRSSSSSNSSYSSFSSSCGSSSYDSSSSSSSESSSSCSSG